MSTDNEAIIAIETGLKAILEPGQVTELRALNHTRPGTRYECTVSGYFSDYHAMAVEAMKLTPHASGVYFTPNPVKPELLARVCNKVKPMGKGDATTADGNVIRLHWLLIDCDSQCGVSGISATDAERKQTFERARAIRDYLNTQGWPEPVQADSGNGAHLMYRIDESTEDAGLVKSCLEALAARFNDDRVHVDTSVFNPARIWKLYGTLARKGEDMPDRPHRVARLVKCPEPLVVVTTDQLNAIAARVARVTEVTPKKAAKNGDFDLESWISTRLGATQHKQTAEGDVWTIEVCPFNSEHSRGEAFIIRRTDGTIGAGCKHNSCTWGWRELRERLEPGCYDRVAGKQANNRLEPESVGGNTPTDFPLTDLGNAERLIAAHGENLRYYVDRGAWLIWNGKRWEHDRTSEIDRLAMKVVRSMYKQLRGTDQEQGRKLFDHIKRSESQPRLAAMVTLAAKLPGVTVQANDLDHDPWLLNCLNGTVDLRSGMLRPHARGDLMTRLCECEYDPGAKCPRWLQFLDEVFQGDAEVTGFVKRLAGYVLTADTREESVFILTGKGQNGKTKMVEALRVVLGDYAADTPFTTFIERRSDSATNDLAALVGKRLITASEGEDTQSFNESLLKQLSGGDPITCRFLRMEFFTYTPTFKVLFCTNEVPRIRSQNFAMKRRLKLVPFRQRFYDREDGRKPVKDDQLLPKLLAEKSGILAWMVEGCLEWRTHGLMTPKVIRAEVERLFESQDPLAEFMEDRCSLGADAEVEVTDLWQEYNRWCENTKRKPAFKAPQWFSKNLTQRDGIDAKRGGKGIRLLTGIALGTDKSDDEDEEQGDASDANSDSGGFTPMKAELDKNPEKAEIASLASPDEANDRLVYACGACKAQVVLTDYKPKVYGYSCESCGHSGVVPHYDYQLWLDRRNTGTAKSAASVQQSSGELSGR